MGNFSKDILANAAWDGIKGLGLVAFVSGAAYAWALWGEFHSVTIMIGGALWVILVIFTLVLMVLYLKDRISKPISASQPSGTGGQIQFYEGRAQRGKIEDLLKHGGPISVITHVGGTIANLQVLEHDSLVTRLILQAPDGREIANLAQSVSDRNESELRAQIELSLSRAKSSKIEVRALDGPMSSVILGRPGNGRGWAQVEVFLPQVDARHRPSFFFKESDYPEAFRNLEKMFEATWKISREVQ